MDTLRHILNLGLDEEMNLWDEVSGAKPQNFKFHAVSLLKIHEWSGLLDSEAGAEVSVVLVDLDAVSRTQPLDAWSLAAWKATLSDLIVRCTGSSGQAPLLMGFARESTWSRAVMGVQVGIRDLTTLVDLPRKLSEIFKQSPPTAEHKNILPLQAPSKFIQDLTTRPNPTETQFEVIPKHVIPFPIEGLDGTSSAVEALRVLIRRSAPMDTPVLLRGPTGSGKELVARALHRYSSRGKAPFVAINCGAISPGLIESELFGHLKGSFTDAHQDKVGLIMKANGGTLFLDEVSELPLETQVKLLRAIQEGQISPVGSTESVSVDVRIVSATKEDIEELCNTGRFRQDLLYRIKVIEISLPALRERRTDIPELAKTLLKKIARRQKRAAPEVSDLVLEKFLLHSWPGNIRQFENVLEHAATLAWAESRAVLQIADLPEEIQFATMSIATSQHLKEVVHRFEKEYIASTVRRLGGSKEEAAEILGLSLATLYRKLGS